MTKPDSSTEERGRASPPRSRRAASYPVAEDILPSEALRSGRYVLSFARSLDELRAVQRLRFEVFNLELGEGLESSFASGLDEDDLDHSLHHLMIRDTGTGEVIGTYRMQTAAMAAANDGFYSAREFDLSGFPLPTLDAAVEVGRACIAREHRSRRVLHLLWRGLAQYLTWTGKHYLFGCCSLATLDGRIGNRVHSQLVEDGHLHPGSKAWPLPGLECGLHDHGDPEEEPFEIPPLFQSYLNLGAKICGPPAVDRAFKTIDFLVILDVRDLDPHVYRSFFR
ncbi:MAG: GNAT family N-acetyltransferase [Gemmatimonadetes bacterium]|nr:GNAT family N-acetyltransferase [Gemmatimonadota bacterium]NNM34451.1 GNAT family N-acetyltransferase [Gemmatimonadota bacterium]